MILIFVEEGDKGEDKKDAPEKTEDAKAGDAKAVDAGIYALSKIIFLFL